MSHKRKIKSVKRINWHKQDTELAHELGVTRERIRQIRKKLRKPKSANHHKHSRYSKVAIRREKITKKLKEKWHSHGLHKKPIGLIARLVGASSSMTSGLLKSLGFQAKDGRKHWDWSLINLDLPNKDLTKIWGCSTTALSRQRQNTQLRCKCGYRGADYNAAVEQEKAKKRYGWPRVRNLPARERNVFTKELGGQTRPLVEGISMEDQDFFYPWDYARWKAGRGNSVVWD